jgi:lipopolysaccharide transport system ATP-binding protein
MGAPVIELDNVKKRYRIGSGVSTLRGMLRGLFRRSEDDYHWALKGVSFGVEPGQAVGVIGPNGAGKTTILKVISRVIRPTSGEMRVNGRLSALIELGAGFHPDLTGRENIYLNGAILGMARGEIRARFDEIVEFAGIGKFLDTPVKRYSSGMYARLGFAIAAHVNPQIMLVDEVLAVGDHAFKAKCYSRMEALRSQGTSILFVSHNMDAVRRVCDRGVVMYRGEAIFHGSAAEAVVAYSDAIRQAARESLAQVPTEGGLSQRVMTFDAEITGVRLVRADGSATRANAAFAGTALASAQVFPSGTPAIAQVDVLFHRPVAQPIFSLTVRTPDGNLVYDTTTRWMNAPTPDFQAGERVRACFNLELPLLDGEYDLGVDIASTDASHYYDRLERALGFVVQSSSGAQGLVDLGAEFRLEKL